MQTRLLSCISGGLFGVVAAYSVMERVDMSPVVTFAGCTCAGIGIGYAISAMIHVFTAGSAPE